MTINAEPLAELKMHLMEGGMFYASWPQAITEDSLRMLERVFGLTMGGVGRPAQRCEHPAGCGRGRIRLVARVSVLPFTRQHGAGPAFCLGCAHTWAAVAPTGVTELECPNCHTMKGKYRFEFRPAVGQSVRECSCGNQLFYLTPEGHLCANCGLYQRY